MYGVYVVEDDELYVMTSQEVWKFLSDNSKVFQSYSVVTDGEAVIISEVSAGANGTLDRCSLYEFFLGFEEEGFMIRKISEHKESA
jgi:hypothetical protein